jgi:hypothetical protein
MKDVNELWDKFNQIEIFEEPLTDKMEICIKLEDIVNDNVIRKQVELEKELLNFYAIMLHCFDEVQITQDKLNYYNTTLKRYIEIYKREDFNYYKHRFSQTVNQSDKVRYGLIVWLYFKDIKFFDISIKLLINRVKLYLEDEQKEYLKIIYLLCFVYNIIILYQNKNILLRNEITDIALSIINNVNNTDNSRWLIEPIEIIIKLRPKFENKYWINLLKTIDDNAEILVNWESQEVSFDNKITKLDIQRHLFEISIQLVSFLDNTDKEKEDLKKRIFEKKGKSFETEAELRLKYGKKERIVASLNYQEAANEYKKAGNDIKYSECIQKMHDNHKLEDYEVIESKIEFVTFSIEGVSEYDTLNNIANLNIELSNNSFIENALNQLKDNPLLSSFPLQRMTELGKSSKLITNNEDIEKSHVKDNKNLYINFFESNLSNTIFNLEKEKKISSDGILIFLKDYGVIDEDNIFLIKKGLDYHFSKEYIASIHILIPQIEVVLRKLLEIKKLNFLKEHKNAIMNKELGGILKDNEIKDIVGENVVEYLKIKYTDINGINFRNKLSHGYLKIDELNHRNSFAIVFALLKLVKYSI